MINRCPHCSQRALSHFRKSALWGKGRTTCEACGRGIRLSSSDWLGVAPFLVLGLVAASGITDVDPLALTIPGLLFFVLFRLVWVPLVSDE